MKTGKRYRKGLTISGAEKLTDLSDAVDRLKQSATAKFDETIEVAMRLGVDPRHAEQQVRGTVVLPHGTGKKIRVLGLVVRSALAVAVRFKSAGSNNISASYSLGINDDLVFPEGEHGWFQTNANEPFVMNQSLAVSSGVKVIWMLIG